MSLLDQAVQVVGGSSVAFHSRAIHSFLNDLSDLLGGLVQHFIHVVGHGVVGTQVLVRRLSCLGVRVQGGLVLLEELLLYCYIMISDAEHSQPVLRLLDGFSFCLLIHDFRDQFVLDQNQSLHGMLQCQFVLAHLAEDGADVQMNISGVQDLQALLYRLLTEVQVVVLNLQCLLQVAECRSELLSPSENAGEIVVSNCPVLVSFVGESLGLSEQLKGHVEVF